MAEKTKDLLIDKDLYELLELNHKATPTEIKKQYKELARKIHPDKNRGKPHSEDLFISVNHAYQYLINPTSRLIYNAFGFSGIEVYETSIEEFEWYEKELMKAIESGEDTGDIEQQIFNKTLIMISEATRIRIYQEYDVNTTLEIGFDLNKHCNYLLIKNRFKRTLAIIFE